MNKLDSILELCQTHAESLSQNRHGRLEHYEDVGSLAFEALLSHIDRLPGEIIPAAMSHATDRLATAPTSLRHETVSPGSLEALQSNPSWPLIRSLTLNSLVSDASQWEDVPQLGTDIERLTLRGGPFGAKLIADLASARNLPCLTALDLSACSFTDDAEIAFQDSPLLKQLRTFRGISLCELKTIDDLRLESVSCNASAPLIHALRDRASEDLRSLILESSTDQIEDVVDALLAAPDLLNQLESLTLSMEMDDTAFIRLASGFESATLRHLSLNSTSITAKSIKFFRSSAPFRSLSSLSLSDTRIGDEGLRQLAAAPLDQLSSLELAHAGIGDDGATALSKSDFLTKLTSLDVSANQIGAGGVRSLCDSDMFKSMKSFVAHGNPIGTQGAEAIAKSRNVSSLSHLYISQIESDGATALAASPYLCDLVSLSLGFFDGDSADDPTIAIANSNIVANLVSLSIYCNVTDAGAKALAESSTLGPLRKLSLAGDVTGVGIKFLACAPRLAGLWLLGLNLCPIGDEGASAIARSEHLQDLIDLQLMFCKLSESGSSELARSENFQSLRWLALQRELLAPWLNSENVSDLLQARIQDGFE